MGFWSKTLIVYLLYEVDCFISLSIFTLKTHVLWSRRFHETLLNADATVTPSPNICYGTLIVYLLFSLARKFGNSV